MSFTAGQLERLIRDDETDGVNGLFFVLSDGSEEPMGSDEWGELGWGSGRIHINGEDYTWKSADDIGGEGQGDYAAIVISVTDESGNTRFFRKEGYYSSYDGTDWEDGDFTEVEQYEKTVTDWRKV